MLTACASPRRNEAKAGAKSVGLRTSTTRSSRPRCRAASLSSSIRADALAGSRRTANRQPEGTICFRISSRFASSSLERMLTPVVLPPGLARLLISPEATMSSTNATIGMVLVACCAARTAASPEATMTLAFSRTSAWASSGKRSAWPSASLSSMRMLRPSTCPSAVKAFRKMVGNGSTLAGELMRSTPTSGRRSAAFCEYAGAAVQRASATRTKKASFDHLVGACEGRARELDAEFAGGLLVDHQLDRARLLRHGLARLGAFQYLVGIGGEHRVHLLALDAIAGEAARLHHLAKLTDCRELVFEGKPAELALEVRQQRRGEDVESLGATGSQRSESRGKIGRALDIDRLQFEAERACHLGDCSKPRLGAVRRMTQQAKMPRRRHDLFQDLELLGVELGGEDANPGGVAAGFGIALDQPGGDEAVGDRDDRDRLCGLLCGARRRVAERGDDIGLVAD